jgi:inositol-pentakisphosphate 2-kinase
MLPTNAPARHACPGAAPRISKYCPLDLFSGDARRMEWAIASLIRTPQNNMKVYRDNMPILLQTKVRWPLA